MFENRCSIIAFVIPNTYRLYPGIFCDSIISVFKRILTFFAKGTLDSLFILSRETAVTIKIVIAVTQLKRKYVYMYYCDSRV